MRFLTDENFDGRVIRGLIRRNPGIDLVRAVDVGLGGVEDPDVLAWAAAEGRIVLTHDVSTMVGFAYERVVPASGCRASWRCRRRSRSDRPSKTS